jgi:hypothetical protein
VPDRADARGSGGRTRARSCFTGRPRLLIHDLSGGERAEFEQMCEPLWVDPIRRFQSFEEPVRLDQVHIRVGPLSLRSSAVFRIDQSVLAYPQVFPDHGQSWIPRYTTMSIS